MWRYRLRPDDESPRTAPHYRFHDRLELGLVYSTFPVTARNTQLYLIIGETADETLFYGLTFIKRRGERLPQIELLRTPKHVVMLSELQVEELCEWWGVEDWEIDAAADPVIKRGLPERPTYAEDPLPPPGVEPPPPQQEETEESA